MVCMKFAWVAFFLVKRRVNVCPQEAQRNNRNSEETIHEILQQIISGGSFRVTHA